jgi:hypothetical protein
VNDQDRLNISGSALQSSENQFTVFEVLLLCLGFIEFILYLGIRRLRATAAINLVSERIANTKRKRGE